MFLRAFLISCCLFSWSFSVIAGTEEAQGWLKRMAMVIKTRNYIGTFIYIHNNHIESMRIIHRSDQSGERERLFSLNGAAREIIRDNNRLICILPDSRSVVVEKSRPRKYIPDALFKLNGSILRNYYLSVLGNDRVAGRESKIIVITPRDKYRYGYRLWLDKNTAMLLKSDVINEKGVAVEQFMFTSLEFRETIDEKTLAPKISGKGFKWFGKKLNAQIDSKKHQWAATRLPDGFKESMYMEHGLPTSRMPVDHLIFTDGLSSVSVYIEKPQKGRMPLKGASNMGAVNAFGKVISGYQVTVVGEVPKATVMLIGNSVKRID